MIKKGNKAIELGEMMEVFTDDQTGKEYSRIVGGLAWPNAGSPGFAIVIAEDFEEDPNLKARRLWVLNEAENSDVAELIRRCQDWRETYQTQDWYGCTSNKAMMGVLYHLQKGLDQKSKFSFTPAPHADDPQGLGYYLPLIKECLGINRKILHFGEGSKLPGYLAEMGPETLNLNPAEYPPIAALGYALSKLRTSDPAKKMIVRPSVRQGPFNWM